MNKYQKALSELKHSDIKLHVYNEQDNIIEEHQPTIYDFYHDEIFVLKELVEKATPKKPKKKFDDIICPHCNAKFNVCDNCTEMFMYCPNCGGKWSDEE